MSERTQVIVLVVVMTIIGLVAAGYTCRFAGVSDVNSTNESGRVYMR